MSKVVIIGAGAAGMMAAVMAARAGHEVILFEKNEKLGKKLFITGKGRCNITNACDMDTLLKSVLTNSRFLYSAFYGFSNEDTIQFFEEAGCKTKVERGGRVFPVSDHSSDVIGVLSRELNILGVTVRFHSIINKIEIKDGKVIGVVFQNSMEGADAVLVATGGLSYPVTGSTGDGYRFAKKAGHTVTECSPGLVPIEAKEDYVKQLQGLSLKNISITILDKDKKLYQDFGEMLFTHFGVSGPLILTAGSHITKQLKKHPLKMLIDLKPALTTEQLDLRLLREFEEQKNKQFKNVLGKLFPAKLIPIMITLSEILPEKKVNEITKAERKNFLDLIKGFPLTLTSFRGYEEAIITQGGVNVKEINPSTMESKLVKGLYFIGEVLDTDAVTGGFNLQIAWSTAYAAASHIPW